MARSNEFNEINITPLTDIFLVLLIIMMVIAPLLDKQGLNLTVPENVAQEQHKEFKIMTVTINPDDSYHFEGTTVSTEELGGLIKEQAKNFPDGLMIKASSDSTHGAIVKLMDNARNSGITSISVDEI